MLAGRNDVASLAYYNSKMKEFADNNKTLNGAYGYRWRNASQGQKAGQQSWEENYKFDQLQFLIRHLKETPNSRRSVLQMWNVEDDLLKIDVSSDVCCNTNAYFLVEDEKYLNMTVCNRSNDMVWGMLGANVVHMSFLLEYMAAHLGLKVGTYNQFTNNLHVYTERWEPEKWLEGSIPKHFCSDCYPLKHVKAGYKIGTCEECGKSDVEIGCYTPPIIPVLDYTPIPLIEDPQRFDKELLTFVDEYSMTSEKLRTNPIRYQETFLEDVALPLCMAFHNHKQREYKEAHTWLGHVADKAWQYVGRQWIEKRERLWKEEQK